MLRNRQIVAAKHFLFRRACINIVSILVNLLAVSHCQFFMRSETIVIAWLED